MMEAAQEYCPNDGMKEVLNEGSHEENRRYMVCRQATCSGRLLNSDVAQRAIWHELVDGMLQWFDADGTRLGSFQPDCVDPKASRTSFAVYAKSYKLKLDAGSPSERRRWVRALTDKVGSLLPLSSIEAAEAMQVVNVAEEYVIGLASLPEAQILDVAARSATIRDELYCQLIVTATRHQQACRRARSWQLIALLSNSYAPHDWVLIRLVRAAAAAYAVYPDSSESYYEAGDCGAEDDARAFAVAVLDRMEVSLHNDLAT